MQDFIFTGDELINDLGLTFVEGAIYKNNNGDEVKCLRTGDYKTADVEDLESGNIYPMNVNDLVTFIRWEDET